MSALGDVYEAVSGWTSHPAVALALVPPVCVGIALAAGRAIGYGTGGETPRPPESSRVRPVARPGCGVVYRPGWPPYDQDS